MKLPSRRSNLRGVMAVGALTLAGCDASAGWTARREFSPTRLPDRIAIMVFESQQVREADDAGISDLVVETLTQDLRTLGTQADVVPLQGNARLPRVELFFRSLDARTSDTAKPVWTLVVDCAVVSAKDEITFAGRMNAGGAGDEIALAAEKVGHLIAETLHRGG